jgi:hypothetical protein
LVTGWGGRQNLVGHPDAILFLRFRGKEFFNTHA